MIYSSQLHAPPSSKEQEYLAGWQRARAELDNFRKRMQQQSDNERARIRKEILASLLPLADNFQAMVGHVPKELQGNAWTDGVMHIAHQLDQLLADHDVTLIEALNQPFDPNQHEATGKVKSQDAPRGHVVEVIQNGYAWRGEIIRPAKVKIAA